MLVFNLKKDAEELPEFDVYKKKPIKFIGNPKCKSCHKKPKNFMIHMYNVGPENLHVKNLFLCIKCFREFKGPIDRLEVL